ncbi:Histone deacetylation protein Rxt3 [Penicillium verhagenii]|nr:Histone deacetylation protein Rxt3 [Penicillium verhagenii]
MLGSDAERPARDPAPSARPSASSLFGVAQTSVTAGMSPPTIPARPSPVDLRRSETPEQSRRLYRSGSGGASSLLSNDPSRFSSLPRVSSSQYPEKAHSTQPSPHISPTDSPYEPRRMSISGPTPRPSSQPPNAEPSARQPGYSPLSRQSSALSDRFNPVQKTSASYAAGDPHSPFGAFFGDRRSEDNAYRDRERDRASNGMEPKGQLTGGSRFSSVYGDLGPANVDRHPSSPESKRFQASELASPGFGFGAIQSYTKSLGSHPGGSRQPSSLHSGHGPSPGESPYLNIQQPQPPPRLGSTPNTVAAGAGLLGLAAAGEEGRRKGSDELLQHRNLLAVGVDGKRGGRASPLPQAVQGAQAPFINPSGEPSIKNELGRVFSGIGSGVGGVTAGASGSGPSTPLTASPFKRDGATARSVNGDGHDNSRNSRPLSASGNRRSRNSNDEDQMELESGGLYKRPSRRARQKGSYHGLQHNHHHHQYVSASPHDSGSGSGSCVLTTSLSHHHKAEEEAAALARLHQPLSTGFFGLSSNPTDPLAGNPYDHRRVPPPPTAAASPIREPRTTVTLAPLLSSIAHLPRRHLGSTLYTPLIGTPSSKSSSESSKFGYSTTPQPLPRFEHHENCTFTVRVPRFLVDQSRREEICARRALWGTGVYTDDSDPVAAAIHSGFIRGAWGDDVDESMLDLEIKEGYEHAPPATEPTEGPRLPPIPPSNQDLQITLLILPRLERYDTTVMFGVKSRKWDGRHDGMSFKVHRVDWVDGGVARGEQRTGQAKRKRMEYLFQAGKICTANSVARTKELRQSGVQVPRTIDDQGHRTPVQPVS